MPTVGTFHTKYWEFSDTSVAPVHLGRGGYPSWQASVIAPSLFGAIGARWDAFVEELRFWLGLRRRVRRLSSRDRDVWLHTLEVIESPAYGWAVTAVGQTATTLGFNRPEAWKNLSRALKDEPGRAENTFRHLEACRRLRVAALEHGSTLANPVQHFTVELAYQAFTTR